MVMMADISLNWWCRVPYASCSRSHFKYVTQKVLVRYGDRCRLPMDLSASQNGSAQMDSEDDEIKSEKSDEGSDAEREMDLPISNHRGRGRALGFIPVSPTSNDTGALDLTPRPASAASVSPGDNTSANGSRLGSPRNTTCHVCYKTFACQSALQIHFRRSVCSRIVLRFT